MSDWIDRKLVLERINKQREHLRPYLYPQDKIGDSAYRICAEFVERIPSTESQRKKGKWIDFSMSIKGIPTECCSECGGWSYDMGKNFCPNCGCRMEEGDAE